jgi:hypothetical protein
MRALLLPLLPMLDRALAVHLCLGDQLWWQRGKEGGVGC